MSKNRETPGDLPLSELVEKADEVIKMGRGFAKVYFEWTCVHCGSRQTFPEANALWMWGICEECGETTSITKGGYTLVLDMPAGGVPREFATMLGIDPNEGIGRG